MLLIRAITGRGSSVSRPRAYPRPLTILICLYLSNWVWIRYQHDLMETRFSNMWQLKRDQKSIRVKICRSLKINNRVNNANCLDSRQRFFPSNCARKTQEITNTLGEKRCSSTKKRAHLCQLRCLIRLLATDRKILTTLSNFFITNKKPSFLRFSLTVSVLKVSPLH